jgi:FMN phosphatase YigB (HAD superfamily)
MTERPTPTSAPGTSSTSPADGGRQSRTGAPPRLLSATTDARLEQARALVTSNDIDVLSLDVFDTLLWRKVPHPHNVFALLALRLIEEKALNRDLDAGAFAVLRLRSEELARKRREESGRGVEVTLREIWETMPTDVLAGATKDDALALEVELERSLLVPDLDVLELVVAAQEHGKRVVGVSDTYFSEAHLRRFMEVPPLGALTLDSVFASSARRIGKGSGLWRIVLDELGVKPKRVLHVGDNHDADVLAPGRLGVRTAYFERQPEQLARVVEREDRHALAPLSPFHGDYGLTALRSKVLHRTECRDQPAALRPLWSFGAACVGPPLAGFADWVHENARKEGVDKVFSLMREGELFARLVNAAASHLNSPVSAEPIWLSRQLCARASIFEAERDELVSLFVRIRMPTVTELCHTLGLDPAEVPGFSGRGGARLSQPWLPEELLDAISGSPDLRARVVARSAELRTRIARYVESMLPGGERRLVLVDLGWGGTIQAMLDKILSSEGLDADTLGLYLMTDERAAGRMLDGVRMRGFLASAGHPSGPVEAFRRSPEVLEQICMPGHGSQVGLTAELEPVLSDDDTPHMQAAGREAVQKGVFAFQREWGRYRSTAPTALVSLSEWGQDRLRSILVRAITAPTRDEADLFAGWLHDENFGGAGSEALVPQSSARAARYLDPESLVEMDMSELYWPFGLAALQDETLARSVEAVTTGMLPADAFASELETGPVELYVDRGWGFRSDGMVSVPARRNRRGLSYAKGTVAGDMVRRVRIDPSKAPSIIRIDWIRLRCHPKGSDDVVTLDFDSAKALKGLTMRGLRPLTRSVYRASGRDPNIVIDVEELAGRELHTVAIEFAFGLLPLPASPLQTRVGDFRGRLRERAKRGRLGSPIRAAYALLRRID